MSNAVFKRVAGLHPGMSVFDLSYTKLFTCDMGKLIPVMCDEVVPGDIFKIGNQSVIRMQPLVALCYMKSMHMCIIFLFLIVSCGTVGRLFITGGADGADASTLPLWSPSVAPDVGSLWDHFGFPVGVVPTATSALYRFLLPRII